MQKNKDLLGTLQTVMDNIPWDLTMFYVDNQDLISTFMDCEKLGYVSDDNKEDMIDLMNNLDDHIKFGSEYNENFLTYLY